MRKYHFLPHDRTPARRRSRAPMAFALVLIVLASPLLYEVTLVVVSQWQTMTGTYREPTTPLLSALGEWSRTANLEFHRSFSRFFNSGPWSPSITVPLALTWAVLMAVMFLRRVR